MSAPSPVVVITRPAAQAEGLLAALRDAGFDARALPLLHIEALMTRAEVHAALADHAEASGWIFTSANAVAALGDAAPDRRPAQIAAIGPATAARLVRLGIQAWTPQTGSDSESLLADPRLAEVAGQRWLIVTGEGGRPLLPQTLRERGAELTVLAVYRREPVAHAPDALSAALDGARLIQFSSTEALDHFCSLVPDAEQRHAADWLVNSARLAEHARRLGYPREPLVAAGPADEDLLAAVHAFMEASPDMSDSAAPSPEASATPPPKTAPKTAPKPAPKTATPTAARASAGRNGGAAWLIALLVVAVALALALRWAWPKWQALQQTLQQHQGQLAELAERQAAQEEQVADLVALQQRASQDAARLRERLETYDEALARLSDEVGGGRERVVLSTAEQLMMIANDRLLLAGDARGAREALALADERLARLADPRLHGVRAAIAEERAVLAALPEIDTAGIALRLDAAITQSRRLPLQRSPVYVPTQATSAHAEGALGSVWQKIRAAASQLFVLRRQDNSELQARLPETEAGLIRGMLQLKLENARSAWLRGEGEAYATVLADARAWLADYFQTSAPEVGALDAELEFLAQIPLQIEVPELSRSLRLLRAQMEPAPR